MRDPALEDSGMGKKAFIYPKNRIIVKYYICNFLLEYIH